ncbi:MAG: glycosyltransferase family 2 protein [Marinilabiliaceae bacterium]|nr:glycosyltransferase family 2 protein [Marinilabiliaceae bacterium]
MKHKYLVSIITINYKQAGMTNELLRSLESLVGPLPEIIIVDNNSGEDDVHQLDLHYSNVKLIQSDKNLGFAGGNNLGIKAASGKYILLLNNDTLVPPDFLKPLVDLLECDTSIGAVSPLITYTERPGVIQYAGFTHLNPFTLRMKAIGHGELDTGQFKTVRETPFAHGCAMILPARIIQEVGLMEEKYFLYYEEHDWSRRIRKAGYKICFQPQSKVYHKESISTGKNSTLKTYFINRNRLLFMQRNYNFVTQIVALFYLLCVSIPKNTLHFLITRQNDHLSAYWDALIWNLTQKTKKKWLF